MATLLVIAGNRSEVAEGLGGGNRSRHHDDDNDRDDYEELDKYELWREMKIQVKALRNDMDNREPAAHSTTILQRDTNGSTTDMSPAPDPITITLPFRPGEHEASKKLANPRLEGATRAMDVDYLDTPLISDEGMFMDLRSTSLDGFMPR